MGHYQSPVVKKKGPQSHGSQKSTRAKVQCPQCGMMIKAKNLESHLTKRCPKRDMQARQKLHVKPPRPATVERQTVPPRRTERLVRSTWW